MPVTNYSWFSQFIEKYLDGGFKDIDRQDPFIIDMEKVLVENKQFFYITSVDHMQLIFASSSSKQLFGLAPEEVSMITLLIRSHPEDQQRQIRATGKTIQELNGLADKKDGFMLQSSQFRLLNGDGEYTNVLFQVYMFYSAKPHNTVFGLVVLSDLSDFKIKNGSNHYYVGTDHSNFRYPDGELLNLGRDFSAREMEILTAIADCLESDQIAEKLGISVNTVNTHRRNIVKKSGYSSTHELIISLQAMGML